MSMIQRSCALVGWSASLIAGTARWRTVRSITYSRQASARTARPIHSRRPARRGVVRVAVIERSPAVEVARWDRDDAGNSSAGRVADGLRWAGASGARGWRDAMSFRRATRLLGRDVLAVQRSRTAWRPAVRGAPSGSAR